ADRLLPLTLSFPYTTLFRSLQRNEPEPVELPWVERGVIVCGDGDYDPIPLLALSAQTGWPLLAEPTSNARRAEALSSYRQLLARSEEHTSELQSRENLVCRL